MLNTDKIYFYPYKIFEVERRKYLYTIYASGLFEIDNTVSKLLQLNGSTVESIKEALKIDLTEDKSIELLTDMENEKLLCRNEVSHDESQEIEKANFSALTLMLAQECNMRCSYCYGEGGEYNNKGIMTENVAFQAIDYLVKNSTDELLHIAFLGGEPLLNFPLLKKVVEYCKQISADTGKKFSYTITTNGTLITDNIEKYLTENKIVCQISLDGTKEKNDMNRFFRNKKGSYDVIVEKTKSMRHMNLVTARATVTPDNSDYKEIFNHLNELELGCCPHENYTNTNNINLASERSCRMAKTIYEKLISVYIKMSDEDKKMMWPED